MGTIFGEGNLYIYSDHLQIYMKVSTHQNFEETPKKKNEIGKRKKY